jgi:hypothetical protein
MLAVQESSSGRPLHAKLLVLVAVVPSVEVTDVVIVVVSSGANTSAASTLADVAILSAAAKARSTLTLGFNIRAT